jgi:DNA-binding response OmpR family regulator
MERVNDRVGQSAAFFPLQWRGEFMPDNRPILLVEDDVVDHLLVKRAFKELAVANGLEICSDAEAALTYLRDPNRARPSIIILDLNMPRLTGIEFLKVIKGEDTLKMIPVVILTTSREEQDKMESFKQGAAGYMIKPVEYAQFVDLMRTVTNYWALSELPA